MHLIIKTDQFHTIMTLGCKLHLRETLSFMSVGRDDSLTYPVKSNSYLY